MNFVEMSTADIDEISALENSLFTDPWPKKYFMEELNNEVAKYVVLKEDEEIIGYAGLWFMFENCDLVNIAVKKEYQGKGTGEKLLRHMIALAIRSECEFMHLEVRVSNLKAYSLYKKYDFIETRVRKGYYENGEDCIDMVKGLVGLSEEDFSD